MHVDLGLLQPESRTLDDWARELCDLSPGSIFEQWHAALVRGCQRGSLGFFTVSTAPRTPRICTSEIRDWLQYEKVDLSIPLGGDPPRLKVPRSFRQDANPAEGRHATRATIGQRIR